MVNKNEKSGGNNQVSAGSTSVEQIKRENNNIYSVLKELEHQEEKLYGQKKEMLLQLVDNYEQLARNGDYKLPLNHICATICSELRAREMWATDRYARDVIPSRFKQTEYDPTSNDKETETDDSRSDSYAYSEPPKPFNPLDDIAQKKPIDEMDDEELREITEKSWKINKQMREQSREVSRRADNYLEECIKRKVAVDEDVVHVNGEEKFTTLVEESGESQLYHALKYYAKVIDKSADKVFKFKPKDKQARAWAKAVMTMAELWKPWADEKYRKDSISWMLVQMDNLAHGKHAAATMNSTITSDGQKRALTREQVGDKFEAVFQQAVRFTTAFGDMVALHRWHLATMEKGIGSRAIKMHGRLSEKS